MTTTTDQAQLAKFYNAIKQKTSAVLVRENIEDKRVRLIFRVPSDKPTTGRWLTLVSFLLSKSEGAPWSLDVSKQYFLVSGQMRFGWRVIFQGENLIERMNGLSQDVQNLHIKAAQLEEVALIGSASRSKTAGLMGTVRTMR